MSAQAKQTKKHCENQDDISDKDGDHARFGTLRVDGHASELILYPYIAKLQCDEPREFVHGYNWLVTCVIPKAKPGLCEMHNHLRNDEGSLTSNEESNVSCPYARYNCHDELVFIPNGDPSGTPRGTYVGE